MKFLTSALFVFTPSALQTLAAETVGGEHRTGLRERHYKHPECVPYPGPFNYYKDHDHDEEYRNKACHDHGWEERHDDEYHHEGDYEHGYRNNIANVDDYGLYNEDYYHDEGYHYGDDYDRYDEDCPANYNRHAVKKAAGFGPRDTEVHDYYHGTRTATTECPEYPEHPSVTPYPPPPPNTVAPYPPLPPIPYPPPPPPVTTEPTPPKTMTTMAYRNTTMTYPIAMKTPYPTFTPPAVGAASNVKIAGLGMGVMFLVVVAGWV